MMFYMTKREDNGWSVFGALSGSDAVQGKVISCATLETFEDAVKMVRTLNDWVSPEVGWKPGTR